MRLRSLELRGFKSFAEPVRLPFSARLIGIVGPNGCGKSNIADALRWIVGEQKSRLLRIEKADNLIFNGSARRKPLPFAEVSLEVEDFSPELPHLVFTRRVYRGGEVEYFLNGGAVRLRDFLAYFWQMGLSAHGILDGGWVEALIHDRGGARRALLESLAGIERYHHHKKEALAELEKTRQALSQVEALLAQLKEQTQELTRQAQKVETYKSLKEAYRSLLASWIAQELAELEKLERRYAEQQQAHEAALAALQDEIQLLEKQIKDLHAQEQALDPTLLEATWRALQDRYQALRQEESTLKERQAQLALQLSQLEEETTHRRQQQTELSSEEATLLEQRLQREKAYEASLQALSALQQRSEALLAQLKQRQTLQAEYETQLKQAAQTLAQLERQQQGLSSQKEAMMAQVRHLQDEAAAVVARLQALEGEVVSLQQRQAALQAQYTEAQRMREKLLKEQQALASEKRRLGEVLQGLQSKLERIRLEKEATEDILARAEGWPAYLAELRRQGIEFWRTEDLFWAEEADMPVLGTLLRLEPPTLWVRSQEAAQRLDAFLSGKHEGFLGVRVWADSSDPSPQGWLKRVQALPGFSGLAFHLWHDVEVGEAPQPNKRVVTPDGRRVYLSDGCIYHLSPVQTTHIGLPHRLERLSLQQRACQLKVDYLRASLAAVERRLERLPLAPWQSRLQTLAPLLSEVEKALMALEVKREELNRQKDLFSARVESTLGQIRELEEKITALAPQIEEARTQHTTWTQALHALEAEVATLTQQREALHPQLTEARVQVARAENDLKALQKTTRLISQQHEEVRKRLAWLAHRKESLEGQIGEVTQRLETIAAERAQLASQLEEVEARLHKERERKKQLEEQLDPLRTEMAQKRKRYQEHELALARLEARQTEVRQKRAALQQRLAVEAEMRIQDLPPPPSLALKDEEVERRLLHIKERIAALGELNFEAVTTLQALREREETLLREKNDVESTLLQLQAWLVSLDREAQERFQRTFEQVRSRFVELFQGLFAEGDTCDLVLVEPDKPLTSEIEILAQPKGKRPLSLHQLSGGEKALTALALVFATFAVRPSALCVLDEVDAPLDEYNSHKFGELLRRFSAETPLLVITHNKTTMSYCEVLYGVTMPEPGVSVVVAVEMEPSSAAVSAA